MTTPTNSALHMMEGQGGNESVGLNRGVVEVCAECDIADCRHIKARKLAEANKPSLQRNAFENFWLYSRAGKGNGKAQKQLSKHDNGDYVDDSTQRHWWTWQAAFATPKTALDHFADEVEASGEAEKHEYPPMPEAPFDVELHHHCHSNSAMRAYVDADRKQRQLSACNFCLSEAAKARALYEKSQELFARERGITKDLAADARRYRWLREEAQYNPCGAAPAVVLCDESDLFQKGDSSSEHGFIYGQELDAAIDAALSKVQS